MTQLLTGTHLSSNDKGKDAQSGYERCVPLPVD